MRIDTPPRPAHQLSAAFYLRPCNVYDVSPVPSQDVRSTAHDYFPSMLRHMNTSSKYLIRSNMGILTLK